MEGWEVVVEWFKEFLHTYGTNGALALALLLCVALGIQLAPIVVAGFQQSASADRATSVATAEQLAHHVKQSEEVALELKAIKEELRQARQARSFSDRLICIRVSKTEPQRDECLRI